MNYIQKKIVEERITAAEKTKHNLMVEKNGFQALAGKGRLIAREKLELVEVNQKISAIDTVLFGLREILHIG